MNFNWVCSIVLSLEADFILVKSLCWGASHIISVIAKECKQGFLESFLLVFELWKLWSCEGLKAIIVNFKIHTARFKLIYEPSDVSKVVI